MDGLAGTGLGITGNAGVEGASGAETRLPPEWERRHGGGHTAACDTGLCREQGQTQRFCGTDEERHRLGGLCYRRGSGSAGEYSRRHDGEQGSEHRPAVEAHALGGEHAVDDRGRG